MRSHVLLVEDDAGVIRAVTRAVRDFCEVDTASTVAEGLAALIVDRRWDAIVADIGLPDGTGLDVINSARTLRPGVPLLAMTGDITNWRVNEAFRLGARVIAKPVRRWMIRSLLDGDYREGIGALFTCVTRYPGRWEESLVAFAIARLENPEWQSIGAGEWPDVLDALERELRAALPEGLGRHRGCVTVH